MKQLTAEKLIFDTSQEEFSNEFKNRFLQTITSATVVNHANILKVAWLDTKLGPMIAIADEDKLYLLEFVNRRDLEKTIERLKMRTKSSIILGTNKPIQSIEKELNLYFAGDLQVFKTPVVLIGSAFQKQIWEALRNIPYGKTLSYLNLAKTIGNDAACRAVARANSTNQLVIVIPCHRVINHNGNLGGYSSGLMRKEWLLNLEKNPLEFINRINATEHPI